MEQLEQYQGHIIRAFEQRPGSWLAEIRKQDGSVIVRKGQRPRELLSTPATRYSAADAIAFAKEAIDSSAMQVDRTRRIARNMAQLTAWLKGGSDGPLGSGATSRAMQMKLVAASEQLTSRISTALALC
jgi:hypothetical protein